MEGYTLEKEGPASEKKTRVVKKSQKKWGHIKAI